ncbi:hypothetical protein CIC12_17635 [Burkholderia sp. SG-MS1]|uniref:TRAP transporter small permease subunit n=1 Tax=Paraburkholderia sp. SG-MS1 TaxID=2023741 RepID=UPI0014480C70|nr:TRAP transporter small permease [Paraburkholderia sp. SG-MS1]NKJ48527.1 hypothetical protein [Paraburkholderia sp. SG-MS1]
MKASLAPTTVAEIPEVASNTLSAPSLESWLDRVCRCVSQLVVVGLIVMIAAEVFVRSVFGWSLQVTDELGGYALIVIAFVSLPSCQAQGAFHHVHFLDARLGRLPQACLRCFFSVVSFGAIAVLCWQFALFTLTSWRSGDVAATTLLTPLWIPRAVMCVGTACLCVSLLRTIFHDWQRIAGLISSRGRRG